MTRPIDVYKMLPRTNCGRCPAGTCMAFAVQVLRGLVSAAECGDLDEESARALESALIEPGDWKERRADELLREITGMDFAAVADGIGAVLKEDCLIIRYMGRNATLCRSGFLEDLDAWDRLLILMYIKRAGSRGLSGEWAAFRELKDGIVRAESFHDACEVPLAGMFEFDRSGFLNRLREMGAEKTEEISSAGSAYVLYPLPRISLLVILREGDEEFGADCRILLDKGVTEYLDVEALLYLGISLVKEIKVRT